MATFDNHLENPPFVGARTGLSGYGTVSDRNYLLHAGSKAALLVFNLGDSSLAENEVVWAIRSAQDAKRRGDLPNLPEYAVVAASYRNAVNYGDPDPPGCRVYNHPDHHMVHRAVWFTDFGVTGPQWGATAMCNSAFGRTDTVDFDTHDFAFRQDSRNLGAYQRSYGWLRGGYWPYYNATDNRRRQRHWQRF